MENQNKNAVRGITYIELLQLMLIGFKLAKIIKWSWFWVFVPTWGSILLYVIFICVILLYIAIKERLKG